MKRKNTALVWSFAVALLAIAPLAVHAAPKNGAPRGRAARVIQAIENAANHSNVKLDDEQKTKVHAVIEDAMAQMAALRQERKADGAGKGDKGDRQAAQEKVAEIAANTVSKVEAVLNDEQKAAFRTALREERAKMREERGDRGGKKGDKPGDKPSDPPAK